MSRVQLALRVADLEGSVAFYSRLFGAEPAKRRPGYANFAVAEPPLKLVLIEGKPGEPTRLDHLGVEVETTDEVTAATARLAAAGLATATEEDTACCYAVQDKVWVTGPGDEPWEVYVVKGDADTLDKPAGSVCCAPAAARRRRARQPLRPAADRQARRAGRAVSRRRPPADPRTGADRSAGGRARRGGPRPGLSGRARRKAGRAARRGAACRAAARAGLDRADPQVVLPAGRAGGAGRQRAPDVAGGRLPGRDDAQPGSRGPGRSGPRPPRRPALACAVCPGASTMRRAATDRSCPAAAPTWTSSPGVGRHRRVAGQRARRAGHVGEVQRVPGDRGVTRAPAPTEMRSPDSAHRAVTADRGLAAACCAPGPFADASAASTGAPRLRMTASAAVAPNATTVAIRQPRLTPARIVAPSQRSPRTYPS